MFPPASFPSPTVPCQLERPLSRGDILVGWVSGYAFNLHKFLQPRSVPGAGALAPSANSGRLSRPLLCGGSA